MAITPDSKDWTWVLHRSCPECGLDAGRVATADLAAMVRENAAAWTSVLDSSDQRLRTRPRPDRWSALEYACHVRDVLRLAERRVTLMLREDDPLFANWDQDATAEQARYAEQDPAVVAGDLDEAATTFAAVLDALAEDGWTRTGRRSDGAAFTVASFGRYLLHDAVHHRHDVQVGLARLDAAGRG